MKIEEKQFKVCHNVVLIILTHVKVIMPGCACKCMHGKNCHGYEGEEKDSDE